MERWNAPSNSAVRGRLASTAIEAVGAVVRIGGTAFFSFPGRCVLFVSVPSVQGDGATVFFESTPGRFVEAGGASDRIAPFDADVHSDGTMTLR